ncbi:MAG: hypothetical protein ACK5IM_11690 [Demequina sp.]|uniref:hypothetical protein n=1 Tax=Demequina sp. TaxID=2050685 RepID=UPI003A88BD27
MGANEDALNAILSAPDWDAPELKNLETSLGALERALNDLGQVDPAKWSGEAARSAAARFSEMATSYRKFKDALADVRAAVTAANDARDRAHTAVGELPDATVPSWIHTAVDVAQAAGEVNVIIDGYAYVADKAVGIFEGWLGNNREEKARQALETLQSELVKPAADLATARRQLGAEFDVNLDDGSKEHSKDDTTSDGSTPGGSGPYAVPPVPSVPTPYVGNPPSDGGHHLQEWIDSGVEPNPEDFVITGPDWTLPDGYVPDDTSGPGEWTDGTTVPGDWQTSTPGVDGPDYDPEDWTYGSPDVDSGSAGSAPGTGIGVGALATGSVAGLAGIGLAGRAARAAINGTSPAGMTSGGLLGSGATGASPAGGLAGAGRTAGSAGNAAGTGARGLARGLSTSASGAPGGAGVGAGTGQGGAAGRGSGSGARGAAGGRGAGAGMGGSGGGKDRKKTAPGLAGHVAPTLDDDDEFTPQSQSARAGERFQD